MNRTLKPLLLTSLAAALALSAVAQAAAPTPLIPRAVLFGNPSKAGARVSPDGKWLAWVAPRDGVLNMWVAPLGDLKAARALTAEKVRPLTNYFWTPDSRSILTLIDSGGDENYRLYAVDIATGVQRALTPAAPHARASVMAVSRHVPDRILVGLNTRDPRWPDVYSLNLKTGDLSLIFQNPGFGGFTVDQQLKVRFATKPRADGGQDLYSVDGATASAQPVETIGPEDAQTTRPVSFTRDGATIYWLDSRGRNTAALIAQDAKTGARTVVGEDPHADVQGVLVDPATGKVQAYGVDYMKMDWRPTDAATKADFDFLKSHLKGPAILASRSDDDRIWTLAVNTATAPPSFWLYDRKAHTVTRLFSTWPELDGAALSEMHPIEFKSRDGLTEVAYLTLPHGADPRGDGHPDKPLPLVVMPHGGPWARDGYTFNPWVQWLADRGYAVLQPNYRSSTGYGKRFIRAGDREWAGKIHDDVVDAVDWAVKAGVTQRDKVAIMGASYGGYETLVGLTFTPDTFQCGVDMAGPSNLTTLLASIPPYWASIRAQFNQAIGDPATPEGQALLKARSPLFKADQIKRPLLIWQGTNDPRVNQHEADQIVDAMKGRNVPVTYLLTSGEGHGSTRPENNIAMFAVAEPFLQKCLGGRSEPFGTAFAGASMTVPYGAGFIPGLGEALPGKTLASK